VWGVVERLGVAGIVDEVVGSRRSEAALSMGTYTALAALNRVVAPYSKLALSDWWATTAGDRLVRVPVLALDHRGFWDAMDVISDEQLIEIERRLVARMVEGSEVDVSGLVLGMTDVATCIDSANDKAPIAQRGKAERTRNDLRPVGLGLVVSVDGGIPLVSRACAGNRHDSSQFNDVVGEVTRRFGALAAQGGDLTVVVDAGQDCEGNVDLMAQGPLHVIGSRPPAHRPDLLAVPRNRSEIVDARWFPGSRAFEARTVVFGREYRIVVTHSRNVHGKQAAGFAQALAKPRRQLPELAARLARGDVRESRAAIEAEIAQILKPRWLDRVVSAASTGTTPSGLRLTWRTSSAATTARAAEQFGKRALFTDGDEWGIADVVAGYRSQSEVGADLRQMKDCKVVSFSPMFHWTDQKTRVHVFSWVLALMIARLMARETEAAKIPRSVREVLSHLSGIRATVLLYQGERGRPRARGC